MKKLLVLIFVSSTLCTALIGQDFHLSQYESAKMYLNPALAGQRITEGSDFNASTTYRSQWGNIASKAFTTSYLGYDQKFKDKWGLGGYLINNQAGATSFRTLNFMLAGSYNIMHESDGKHILTTGLQVGLMNKSLNSNNLTFDQQYSSVTGEFDQSAFSGETFQSTSLLKLDVAWGIYYSFNPPDKNYKPYAGFSVTHLSFPGQNFTEKNEIMPMQWKFNAGCDWNMNEQFTLTPGLLYMYQKAATELIAKTDVIYHLQNEDYDIRAKLGYRLSDAAFFGVGMRYRKFIGLVSYDYNTSYLNNFTGGNGGFEISISYLGAFADFGSTPSLY